MRTSTPNSWYRSAAALRVLLILMITLVVLAAASAASAVEFTSDTPPGTRANPLPDTTYGAPYGPIIIKADGTNAQTQFFIDPEPPDTYNPPLGTRLPYGLDLVRIAQNEARIQGTVTEIVPGSAEYAEVTFVLGVTGDANTPPGSGTYSGRGYLIRVYRAPLTVTVNNQSRAYGAANPELTYTVSGLRNGDTVEQVFQGALATTADASSAVGNYNITEGTLALTEYGQARYTRTFNPGTLSVTPAPLTVRANDATRRVGAPNPTFTATFSGLVNGEGPSDLDGTLSFTTQATATSPVGTYPITPGGLTSTNYAITFEDGTLTVTDRDVPAIAWPTPAAITYGTPLSDSQLNATASVNGQPVAGTLTYTPAEGTVLAAGTQNLQVVFTPTDTTNFAPVTANTTITVNRAPLTVTANNATRMVGMPNPPFSASFSGLVNGEGPSVLGGTLGFTTPATVDSSEGSYPIVPSGLTSDNYTITYVNGTLTVTDFRLYLPIIGRSSRAPSLAGNSLVMAGR